MGAFFRERKWTNAFSNSINLKKKPQWRFLKRNYFKSTYTSNKIWHPWSTRYCNNFLKFQINYLKLNIEHFLLIIILPWAGYFQNSWWCQGVSRRLHFLKSPQWGPKKCIFKNMQFLSIFLYLHFLFRIW